MSDQKYRRSLTAKKGWVTRLIKDCEVLLASDQLTYNKLHRLIETLKEKWCSYVSSYELLETKLMEKEEEEDYDEFTNIHDEYENKYRIALDKFESKLDSLTHVTSNSTSASPKVSLPDIHLPEFSGDTSEWPSFWDKFNGLIHCRADIAKINKFSYLLGQLKSEALSVISALVVTEENYDIALRLLKETYEDKDLFTYNLVLKILDVSPPNHNLKELQSFRIIVNSTLESLRLYHNTDAAEWFIRVLVQRKLPKKTLDALYFKYSKSHFTLKEIDATLLELCKQLQGEEKPKTPKLDSKPQVTPKKQSNIKPQTTYRKSYRPAYHPNANLSSVGSTNSSVGVITPGGIGAENLIGSYTTNVNKNPSKQSRICVFCSAQHNAVNCDHYKGSEQRKQRLAQLGKCTLCLSSYHQQSQCRTPLRPCHTCKEIHHIVLCNKYDNQCQSTNVSSATQDTHSMAVSPAAVPIAEVKVKNKE